ncbi:MAG TPA: hypothetical protein VGB38_04465 [bacterium]
MRLITNLYRRFTVNYKIKLFSLLSALFFWFYVVIDNTYTHVTDVPLRLVNKPEGFILMSRLPSSVRVEFRGTGKAFFSYSFRDRKIELDLHRTFLKASIPLSIDMIQNIPPGTDLRPVRIVDPDSVFLEFDRYIVKRIPVRPDIRVRPRDGFIQVGDVQPIPDSITVAGPQSFADAVLEAPTKMLEFMEVETEISGKVPLVLASSESIHYSDKIIRYVVDVQRLGEREIKEIPIRILHAPTNVRLSVVPSALSLKLQGGVDVLSRLNVGDISVVVDYENRPRMSGNKIPAMIRLPKDVFFSDVHPKVFELIVEK